MPDGKLCEGFVVINAIEEDGMFLPNQLVDCW